jgi:hypothetical protein
MNELPFCHSTISFSKTKTAKKIKAKLNFFLKIETVCNGKKKVLELLLVVALEIN